MLVWRAEALLLSTRRLGEADAIAQFLTREHGRVAAVVKGGAGRRLGPTLQPGDTLQVDWRARLEEHIGTARVESARARAGAIMVEADALMALGAACALLTAFLPERAPHPGLWRGTVALFDALAAGSDWSRVYALWELALLDELGFGLDLSACAATGAREDLTWVSPKSGRAVGAGPGAPYADRLLPLPAFLRGGAPEQGDVAAALRLTGFFIERRVAPAFGLEGAPAARARLAERFNGAVASGGPRGSAG